MRRILLAAALLTITAAPAWATDPQGVGASCTPANIASGPNRLGQIVFCVGGVEVNAFTSSSAQIVAPVADPTYSIAIGGGVLLNDSTAGGGSNGLYNTGVGYNALTANTTGNTNVAVGYNALTANTTGTGNTALGFNALKANTTASQNTATGINALYSNTGSGNTASGTDALYDNTTGSNNTALGFYTLQANTSGGSNTAIGYAVGYTTLQTGSNNILIGTGSAVDTPAAATSNFLNIGNTIFATGVGTGTVAAPAGYVGIGLTSPAYILQVSQSSSTTSSPATIGFGANSSGNASRFALDGSDGLLSANGDRTQLSSYWGAEIHGDTLSGSFASLSSGTSSDAALTIYGGNTNANPILQLVNNVGSSTFLTVTGTGSVGIGTTTPGYTLQVNGSIAGTSAYNNTSDERLKKNIVQLPDGLALIEKLRGVTFNWRTPEEREIGKAMNLPVQEKQIGFIAQEVEKVIPEAVHQGADALYTMQESDIIPALVEAVKQLKRQNEILFAALTLSFLLHIAAAFIRTRRQ